MYKANRSVKSEIYVPFKSTLSATTIEYINRNKERNETRKQMDRSSFISGLWRVLSEDRTEPIPKRMVGIVAFIRKSNISSENPTVIKDNNATIKIKNTMKNALKNLFARSAKTLPGISSKKGGTSRNKKQKEIRE